MFKIGDQVVIKNRPHKTRGCEQFHEDTEVLKKNQTVLTIRGSSRDLYGGRSDSFVMVGWEHFAGNDWEWNAEDLELLNTQLEND